MRVAGLFLWLAPAALLAQPALGAVECTMMSEPGSPSATSAAFDDDITFEATAHVACALDGDPVAVGVCISARPDAVSGTTGFRRQGRSIDYTLRINGVRVDDGGTEIFSGTVPANGLEMPVRYHVASLDYAGVAEGAYTSSFTWTIHHDPPICD